MAGEARECGVTVWTHNHAKPRTSHSLGDPEVLIGAAGGGGGRGRAQVNHKLLIDTLCGFFKCTMLNEYNTSKMTTCCHTPAHAPKSAGRSRGCKQQGCCSKAEREPTHTWWDRDTGAAW